MAKGNNNIRNKKPHSSKPYDVSNSFVKKVTSGVSNLLPHTSWLSRWFASGSTAVEERPPASSEGGDHEEELANQSPPAKRARIPLNRPFPANSFRVSSPIDRGENHPWPGDSVASPIPNVFSDSTAIPGPSGLNRSPVASGSFQSPTTGVEGLEGKINGDGGSDSSESTSGCSSLAPQRATASGSPAVHRASVDSKLPNHLSYSLFPSATHKFSPTVNSALGRRRPSFNVSSFGSPTLDSSKLSRESSLNSPFYMGRTIYGGASAYRRPREGLSSESLLSTTRRGGVTVRPANEKSQSGSSAEAGMSQTARRILEALEQFSSPVSEARRMPLPQQPPLSAKRKRTLDSMSSTPSKSSTPTAASSPLTIPMPPERLRLHRLQDVTEAARRIASSVTSSNNSYTLRCSDDGPQRAGIGKVTKSKPLDEEALPIPVFLPQVTLPITTLPSFELFSPLVQSSPSSVKSRTDSLITSKPMGISGDNSDKVEAEKTKMSSATSTATSFTSMSNVDSSAVTNSGMKPINFMHVKSSADMPKFKVGADEIDAIHTKCVKNSEISSKADNMVCSSKFNPKSVSFQETLSYYGINNPVAFSNPKGKNEKSNSSLTPDIPNDATGTTFMAKSTPFSNVSADSGNNVKTNEYVFSTPTVLPTSKSKETTELKVRNFDFCKPEVLDYAKCDNKLKRNEPNGFHQIHSCSKIEDSKDSAKMQSASGKEASRNTNGNKGSECDSESTVPSKIESPRKPENNGWGSKFSMPDTWECPSCMVRNKKEVQICVCCGSKQSPKSVGTADNKEKDNSEKMPAPSSTAGWGSKFKLQSGMWECSACLVRNKESDVKCVSCTTPRAGTDKSATPATKQENWSSQFRLNAGMWECSVCLVRNKDQDTKCISCTSPRPGAAPSKAGSVVNNTDAKRPSDDWGQKFKKPAGNWECPVCMIQNKDSLLKCAACQEPKPGMDKSQSNSGSSIKFNFEMPSGVQGFKFGIDKADGKLSEATNSPMFAFGGNKKPDTTSTSAQSNFSFGMTSADTKIPAGITFGIPKTESPSTASTTVTSAGKSAPTVLPAVPSVTSVPSSTSSNPAKPLPHSDSSKAGFTFGVPASNPTTTPSVEVGESKKVSDAEDGNSGSSGIKFQVSQASPVTGNIDNVEKTSVVFTAPVSKMDQKTTAEVKPSFNFGTSTTDSPKSTALSFTSANTTSTTTTTTTTASTVASTTATTTASTVVSSTTTTTSTSSTTVPTFSFGSNAASFAKSAVTSAPTFSFGSTAQSATGGFFGANASGQFKQSSTEGLFSTKSTVSSTVAVFGGSVTSKAGTPSLPSFGSTTTAPTTTSVSTFAAASAFASSTANTGTFGGSTTKLVFASPTSGFGSVTTSVSNAASTTTTASAGATQTPSFGVSAMPNTTASFGVPATSSGFNPASIPPYGTSSLPTSTTTNTSTNVPISSAAAGFGAPSIQLRTVTSTGSGFGANNPPTTFSTTTAIVFGATSTPSFGSAAAAAAAPGFGTTPNAPNFGNTFGGSTTTTTAASSFGTTSLAVTTASSTSSLPVFGGFASAAKPSQGVFLFGTAPTTTALGPNFSFNTASQAGATQPTVSSTPVFGFGSAAVSNATNVTTSTTTTPTAAAAAPAQGFGGFSFNTGNTPAAPSAPTLFGNTAPAAPVFGAAANPTAAAAPAFGANNSTNAAVFRPATFNFGSGTTQQPFSFGSGTQAGTTQAPGNAGFPFQPAPSQPLQFNPHARPTFNFTGGDTPQFTASAQTAAATPPQRRVKKAVRRTLR